MALALQLSNTLFRVSGSSMALALQLPNILFNFFIAFLLQITSTSSVTYQKHVSTQILSP